MKRTVLEVIGQRRIHCSGCEERIRNAIGRRPGVTAVEASSADQTIESSGTEIA